MHRRHARLGPQERAHLVRVHAAWHGIHGGIEAVAQQAPRPRRHHRRDQQGGGRIEPGPAQRGHSHPRQDSSQRDRGVGHQVQEGPALVEVVRMPVPHQPGGPQVDQDAQRGHHDDGRGGDVRGRSEPAEGFPAQRAREHHQQYRIGERGQQGGAAPAVGMPAARGTTGDRRGAPRQRQPQHVAQVVQGIRQQGQRIGVEAITRFERGIGQVDQGDRGERTRCRCMRMRMRRVAVSVSMSHGGVGCRQTVAGHYYSERQDMPVMRAAQPRPFTSVPTCSPRRMRIRLPGTDRS